MNASDRDDIGDIIRAYMECALWSSTDEDGESLDGLYHVSDIHSEAEAEMQREVSDFLDLLDGEGIAWEPRMSPEQFGHDFWLTRNGHGAGFWDRGLGDLGDVLTKWAKTFGGSDLYVGDDGWIHVA